MPLNAISSHFCKVGWKLSLMLLSWKVANTCQRLEIEGKIGIYIIRYKQLKFKYGRKSDNGS